MSKIQALTGLHLAIFPNILNILWQFFQKETSTYATEQNNNDNSRELKVMGMPRCRRYNRKYFY